MIALQNRPGPFEDLDWLIQVVVVVVFFVLPVVRTLMEKRKKSARGAAPGAPPQRAKPERPSGRDLWKDLIEGKLESRAPGAPTSAPPPVAASPKPRAPAEGSRSVLSQRSSKEPKPVPEATPAVSPPPSPERVQQRARRDDAPYRPGGLTGPGAAPSGERLGEFEDSLVRLEGDSRAADAGRGSVRAAAGREVDPGTLDAEIGRRWGPSAPVEVVRDARAELVGAGLDWRRAILLSEMLSPPLAMRGPSSAWPGPPAALQE